MEDSDTVSNFSSIAEAPDHLEAQYDPLSDAFKAHPLLLPSPRTPESNSDAMIRALKALQEKIRRLEVERVSAADRLSQLESKTTQTRTTSHGHVPSSHGDASGVGVLRPPVSGQLAQAQQNLQERLESIDRKFSQQSRELREMRKQFEEHSKSPPGYDTVDAGPAVSAASLKTSRRRTPSSPDRVTHSESPVPRRAPARRKKAKSTHKVSPKKQVEPFQLNGGKPQPGVHYRLDMRDVPFVAGTSLSPSFSVGANYQRVVSLMKSHTPLLCGAVAASSSRKLKKQRCVASQRQCPLPPSVSMAELQVLLAGLEEELGELTFQHQQLALKADSEPVKIRGQLQQLVEDLEAKAMQIDIVQRQMEWERRRKVGGKRTAATGRKVKSKQQKQSLGTIVEEGGRESRGEFLRRMKSIQKTLQSDDLTWK